MPLLIEGAVPGRRWTFDPGGSIFSALTGFSYLRNGVNFTSSCSWLHYTAVVYAMCWKNVLIAGSNFLPS